MHELLADVCAACLSTPVNPVPAYATEETLAFHRRAANAPRTPSAPMVRVRFDSPRIHAALAAGCGCWQKEGNVAKDYALQHLPAHHVGAGQMDEVVDLLCNLQFIEARVQSGLVPDLLRDYQIARNAMPEAQADMQAERRRQERAERWTREIIEYARKWTEARKRHRENPEQNPLPKAEDIPLPEIIPCEPLLTDDQIEAECQRIIQHPTRRDRLEAFANFVGTQSHHLARFGTHPGFVLQQAMNYAPSGPVRARAEKCLEKSQSPMLLQCFAPEHTYNPKPACLFELQGHTDSVASVCVTPDASRAVSGSHDGEVRMWDLKTGECLHVLERHDGIVHSVGVTPDGLRAVSGSWRLPHWLDPKPRHSQHVVCMWDLTTGSCLKEILQFPTFGYSSLNITPDGAQVVWCGGGDLQMYDLLTGGLLEFFSKYGPKYLRVKLAPGRTMSRMWPITPDRHGLPVAEKVSITSDGLLEAGVIAGRGEVTTVSEHPKRRSLGARIQLDSITLDGKMAVWLRDNGLEIWNLDNGQCVRRISVWHPTVASIAPDGRHAISGSANGSVHVWNLHSGRGASLRGRLGHQSSVQGLRITADGLRAISWGGSTLCLWDVKSGQRLQELHDYAGDAKAILKSKNFAGFGVQERYRDIFPQGPRVDIDWIAVTPDGRRAVSSVRLDQTSSSGGAPGKEELGQKDYAIWVYDMETGRCLQNLDGHTNIVPFVRVTPDGRRAVSQGDDDTLRVWDVESGQCLRVFQKREYYVRSVSVAANGQRGVFEREDHALSVWNLVTGQCSMEALSLSSEYDGFLAVSVAWDIQRAMSASYGGKLQVWDLNKGMCVRLLQRRESGLPRVNLTEDGLRAVVESADGSWRIWDLESGRCLCVLGEKKDSIKTDGFSSVRVAPGGLWAVSASSDRSLRVWDLSTGECRRVLGGHRDESISYVFTPDGLRVVSWSGEQKHHGTRENKELTLRLWDLASGQCLAAFPCPAPISIVAISPDGRIVSAGTSAGEVLFFELHGVTPGLPLVPVTNPSLNDKAYEELLRRGLEFSRPKGQDHPETLAHLAALAVHLERMGRTDEARGFAEEHERQLKRRDHPGR